MAEKKRRQKQEEVIRKDGLTEEENPEQADAGLEQTPEAMTNQVDENQEEAQPDEMDELKNALQEATQKSAEYLEGWQRARAEFLNYKKRVERERQQRVQDAVSSIALKILPVVDDLERALKNRPTEGDAVEWAAGIELIYKKLQSILAAEGVTPMQAEGEMFDPNLHEAIAQMPSDGYESGQIIEVVQQGYMIGDRVLRPALVRVAS